jgi:hypothetical protein
MCDTNIVLAGKIFTYVVAVLERLQHIGTNIMILKIILPKNLAAKLRSFLQTLLVFAKKNCSPKFGENRRK